MRRTTSFVLVPVVLLLAVAIAASGGRPSAAQEAKGGGTYVGEKTCRKCHFKEAKVWKETKHAKAFEVLPEKYKGDEKCLACHVTGHGKPGGFTGPESADLAAVACEACHGPGSAHAEFGKANEAARDDPKVKAQAKALIGDATPACVRCHMAQQHKKHVDYEGAK